MFEQIVQAIRKIYGDRKTIPLHEPVFLGKEKEYMQECIDSTFVSSVGKYVDEFEARIAEYTGTRHAVAAMNGTAALHLCLVLNGTDHEHEVITQPLTFIATINAIAYTGAKPVFIDVDKKTMGLSAEKLADFLKNKTLQRENGITFNKQTGRRISSCIPMHTFGHPADVIEIKALCDKYNITLIEDAAESLGSRLGDKHTGAFGKMGIFSFNGNKIITTGGGGMIVTNDDLLAKKAKHLSTQAKAPHRWEFIHDHVGFNYRLPNINAAMGCAQMEYIDKLVNRKREIAEEYARLLENIPVAFFREPNGSHSNYWLNVILFNNREERDGFLNYANRHGILARPAWRLIPKLEIHKNHQTENIDNAHWLEDRLVNIPSTPTF